VGCSRRASGDLSVGRVRWWARLGPPSGYLPWFSPMTSWRLQPSWGTSLGAKARWGWRRAAVEATKAVAGQPQAHPALLAQRRPLKCPTRSARSPCGASGGPSGRPARFGPTWCGQWTSCFDQTSDGRMLKFLNVVDEFTREALATDVERSIDADGVIRCLDRLAADRGAPVDVRFDNGPEFIAHAVADWCRFNGTGTVFIDPGSPWQNAWVESFNGRMRDEHLNGQQFDSLLEAKILTENWRIDYNMNRPHSAHAWLTPVEFVEAWLHRQAHQLA